MIVPVRADFVVFKVPTTNIKFVMQGKAISSRTLPTINFTSTTKQTFDLPQMNPACQDRANSNVAQQALYLLNNTMVRDLSARFARNLKDATPAPDAQIQHLYLSALSRSPTKEELETQIKNLEGQLAQMRQVLSAQSEALNRNRQNARPDALASGSKNLKSNAPTQTSNQVGKGKTNPTAMQNASVSTPKFRKHVIRSNDTFYKLASHYRVDFKSIQSANPGVNSTKLQIGQVVNVPYSTKTASR